MPARILPARILFVCLGNICRSPMAEGAMRRVASDRGLAIEIDSAGTGSWHVGEPPDPRAQATARRHGVDIAGLRARQVRARDFLDFTHVVALDGQNFRDLAALRPRNTQAELTLLLDYLPDRKGQGVRDPYFDADEGFETVWADIVEAVEALADRLAGMDALNADRS
ncbi:low molecular weight protein-tyrosine-phosphatase [Sphingobium aquiterrae]|uniref:low molecular weight protein-tyrosine-phosphatase n=1 Tax=Sphingobium aquiterrae TaxID=2038656 RepID=UPI003018EABB